MARKILLADDSVTAQNMGRKILADAGYEVVTVNNGSAALKRISETKPDLIVLDVYMPGYSGLEVCQRLKESGDTSRIPIVLTVGKLEPFKPEEAKRVRADGFIVKPFEASELLSALSKLEDRIVPRSEPTKPGRFARANAALDAAYDKTVANADDDTGWKNRIQFPSAKKKAAEPEYSDDPAIYNPVNKDLRTKVETTKAETKKVPKSQEAAEEARVDLGALAPEGLPKDVTPEEIAALAAAAAQVKAKLTESESATSEVPKPAAQVAESKVEEIKAAASKLEDKAEQKLEAQAAPEPKEAAGPEAVSQLETKVETVPVEAPAIAANAEHAPVAAISVTVNSGNGTGRHEEVPATMAVAAGSEHSAIPQARWKAVPVAILADEAALSLEEEMRKALAAVAAAEMAQPVSASTLGSAPEVVPAASEISSPIATAVAEPVAAAEAAPTMSAVTGTTTDPISEAVKDLEAVAASYPEFHKPVTLPVVEAQSAIAEAPSSAPFESGKNEASVAEIAQPVAGEPKPKAEITEAPFIETGRAEEDCDHKVVEAKTQEVAEATKSNEGKIAETKISEAKLEEGKFAEAKTEEELLEADQANATVETPKAEEPQTSASVLAEVAAVNVSETTAVATTSSESSNEEGNGQAAAFVEQEAEKPAKPAAHKSVFGRIDEMAKKESEMAEHTAAAWASWRRIRDDGKGGSSKDSKDEKISTDDAKAAMAVAAGAEKAPEEAAAGEDSEVSAIVDSVLADLRPKIVEEISRKLGKKK